jgi:hypothetical protein
MVSGSLSARDELELTVDFGSLEFAGGDAVLEQQVQLAEGAVLGLGETEIAPYVAKQVRSSIEQARFCTPVPS